MISEFVWLDLIERSESTFHCSCSLPDPDLYSEDKMIICGDVLLKLAKDGNVSTTCIKLFDNLSELCVGDTYQRKAFVQAISVGLLSKFNVDIRDSLIDFSDGWGDFSGYLDSLDNINREKNNEQS